MRDLDNRPIQLNEAMERHEESQRDEQPPNDVRWRNV